MNEEQMELIDASGEVVVPDELMDEEVNQQGVDVPEVRKDPIDYDRYENLEGFFVESLIRFSNLISLSVPDQFKKDDEVEQELNSTRAGIKAYKVMIDTLRSRLKDKDAETFSAPENFNHLWEWYVDGITSFMATTMGNMPDKLVGLKSDDPEYDNYVLESALSAFNSIRKMLVENVKGLSK